MVDVIRHREQVRLSRIAKITETIGRSLDERSHLDFNQLVLAVADEFGISTFTAKELIRIAMYRTKTKIYRNGEDALIVPLWVESIRSYFVSKEDGEKEADEILSRMAVKQEKKPVEERSSKK